LRIAARNRSSARAVRDAKESAEQVRLVADHVPAKISYVDRDLRYRFNNAAYADWYGVDVTEIVGKHVRDVLGEATYEERLPYMLRALAGETVAFESRSEHRRLGMRMTDIVCVPDVDHAGNVRGFFVMGVDTTERQRAEAQLRESDRRKDEFLAMLAHELRNPLAPISTGAHLLKLLHSDNAQITQTCSIIVRQVDHMTSLVDDLLDVSRVTRGLVSLATQVLDFKRVVDDAAEQIRPLIAARRHRVVVDVPPAPAYVKGDHKRLVQVCANLLNNATKYTPEGGTIQLRLEAEGNDYVLTVADDGIGMEPVLVERVFDLFTQAERTPDRSQGGLGLGLALVKSLVELHGGEVKAYSAGLGKGSTFTVRLPRYTQDVVLAPAPVVGERQGEGGVPLRILLVDDNVDAVHTLQLFLRSGGHQVEVAYSATDALELAKSFVPEVCLLDIGLPDFDGNELARRLRMLPQAAGATLIAMTGYGRQQDRETSMAAGFDHYLVKPVNTTQLADILAAAADANIRR
jgi:PAS domain S-box-containing protein